MRELLDSVDQTMAGDAVLIAPSPREFSANRESAIDCHNRTQVPPQIERLFDHFVGAVLDHDSCRTAARIRSTEKFSQGVIWTLLPRNGGT